MPTPLPQVLLVDDHAENLLALEAILEGLPLKTVRANSGAEALRWLLTGDFALILLDVQMPDMNGFETARMIKAREQTAHIPIIFLTALNTEEKYMDQGYAVGAVDYLLKPFDPTVLRSKVTVFIDMDRMAERLRRQASLIHTQAMEIAARQRFTERLLETVPCGIAYVDAHLVCRVANAEFLRITDTQAHELIDRPVGAFLPLAAEPLGRVLASGESFHTVATPLRGSEDRAYQDISYQPLMGEDGRPEGVLVSCVDVSGHVAGAHAQSELIAHLREVDAMKDRFLSLLSHELRTPINAITGFGSILGDGLAGSLNDQQQTYVEKILGGADILLNLINDLLDISRMQAGKFSLSIGAVSFSEIVDAALAILGPMAANKHHSLTKQLPDPSPLVAADGQRLQQVLVNLLSNAVKFTPAGGQIEVRAQVVGDQLRCEVVDTGVGIAQEHMPRLFKRFQQIDMSSTRQAGGTGLGLYITKALIEGHGGQVGVDSEPGAGSTFWFTLPLAAKAASCV